MYSTATEIQTATYLFRSVPFIISRLKLNLTQHGEAQRLATRVESDHNIASACRNELQTAET